MREIKFRLWDKKGNKMYLPHENQEDWYFDDEYDVISFGLVVNGFLSYANSESGVLLQFTGLFDKNGKEVYEGDFIKVDDLIHEVVFDCAGFMADGLFLDDYWNLTNGYLFEVVGNKFENPELIEGAS